jgi:TonB family protein
MVKNATQIHNTTVFLELTPKDNGFSEFMSTLYRHDHAVLGFALALSLLCHFFVALSFPLKDEDISSEQSERQRFFVRLHEVVDSKKPLAHQVQKRANRIVQNQPAPMIPALQKKKTSPRPVVSKKSAPKPVATKEERRQTTASNFIPAPSAGALMNRSFATLGSLAFPVRKEGRVQKVYVGEPIANPFLSAYVASFEHKIKRVGSLHFPSSLHQGNVALTIQVEIDKTGELKKLKVLRSSGVAQIDEVTRNIITIASPFGPFPKDLAQELDALQLVRVIRFRGDSS